MTYEIKRSDFEVDTVLNRVSDNQNSGKRAYPGMSYEDGVEAGLRWVMGETDDEVFDETQDGDDEDSEN